MNGFVVAFVLATASGRASENPAGAACALAALAGWRTYAASNAYSVAESSAAAEFAVVLARIEPAWGSETFELAGFPSVLSRVWLALCSAEYGNFQEAAGPDAGDLQDLRGVERAAAEDDFAPCGRGMTARLILPAHPRGAFAVQHDL